MNDELNSPLVRDILTATINHTNTEIKKKVLILGCLYVVTYLVGTGLGKDISARRNAKILQEL